MNEDQSPEIQKKDVKVICKECGRESILVAMDIFGGTMIGVCGDCATRNELADSD